MVNTEIKTLIIEDEKEASLALQQMLNLLFGSQLKLIGSTVSIQESIDFLHQHQVDLVLADISLKDGSSFDIFKDYSHYPFKIIFTTSHNEFAIKAFKFNALDYLLKPIDPEELQSAVKLAIKEIGKEKEFKRLIELQPNKAKQKIVLKTEGAQHLIQVKDILYLKAEGSYTLFKLPEQKILVSKNLKYYEQLLEEYGFIRPHHSYLVNQHKITEIGKDFILLSALYKVPTSTRKRGLLDKLTL